MKGIVRLLVLACGLAAATVTTASSQLSTLQLCQYACVDLSTRQSYYHSYYSTYAQCCYADTETFCPEGQTLRGRAWGNPPERC